MIKVGLRNPEIILMPITEREKEKYEKDSWDGSLYVLYKTPLSEEIQIGMLSASMQRYFPATANVWNLEYATSKAYFYNGCSELEKNAELVTDRPVYKIRPSDKRTVLGYDILNGTKENGLRVWLEDVVDGTYAIDEDPELVHRHTR